MNFQFYLLKVTAEVSISPFNYQESLYIPLTVIVPNTGPPSFKTKLSNIKMTVNDLRTLMFPSMVDPDIEDTASLVSCDFGMASRFIQGRYPSFKIEPSSNDTDPGLYEVKVILTDDNPNK